MASRRLTLEQFVERARAVHGDKYDYSEVAYVSSSSSVRVLCPDHGAFLQTPSNHLAGKGCVACGRLKTGESRALSQDEFLRRVREIHGEKVITTGTVYTGWENEVVVGCAEHGSYSVLPPVLLRARSLGGCVKCAVRVRGRQRLTTSEFAKRASELHDAKYTYENADYRRQGEDITVTCPTHGDFTQAPNNHLQGKGCPKCAGIQSRPEAELIEWVKLIFPKLEVIERTRRVIAPLELDIYIPELKVAIEFNGLFWHAADRNNDRDFRLRHVKKLQACRDAGIRLIQIREDRWRDKNRLCKSMIASALKMPMRKESARSCSVIELTSEEAREFMDGCHLEGNAVASKRLGLVKDGHVVSAMTFAKPRYVAGGAAWELVRFASSPFVTVRGGASKLLAAFRRDNPGSIVSYCDLEYGSGGVYRAIGMRLQSQSAPGYLWVKNGQKHFSRYQTQKHKLAALLPSFDPTLSESENMFNNQFRRYWNSGNYVFMTD